MTVIFLDITNFYLLFQEKKSPVGSNEDNAVFEQEFLYRESSFCQDIDEDMEFSSCNGATSSSNCSEVTSASYDEASSREDIISDNCLSATRIGKHYFLKQQKLRLILPFYYVSFWLENWIFIIYWQEKPKWMYIFISIILICNKYYSQILRKVTFR